MGIIEREWDVIFGGSRSGISIPCEGADFVFIWVKTEGNSV